MEKTILVLIIATATLFGSTASAEGTHISTASFHGGIPGKGQTLLQLTTGDNLMGFNWEFRPIFYKGLE